MERGCGLRLFVEFFHELLDVRKWCCVVVCGGIRFHLLGYFVGMGHDFQVQSGGCLTHMGILNGQQKHSSTSPHSYSPVKPTYKQPSIVASNKATPHPAHMPMQSYP